MAVLNQLRVSHRTLYIVDHFRSRTAYVLRRFEKGRRGNQGVFAAVGTLREQRVASLRPDF